MKNSIKLGLAGLALAGTLSFVNTSKITADEFDYMFSTSQTQDI